MKYLNTRDEFLKKSIKKIDEYKSLEEDLKSINESADSGPFANDIPWNDSLLGRLINSTIRKAKIGANLVRIKAVNRRLKESFDELVGKSALAELPKEEKREYSKVKIFSVLESLKKSIENKDKLPSIKNLTDLAIKNLESINNNIPSEELFTDKDNIDRLIKQLKEFREFLNQLDEESEGEESESEESESEDQEIGKNTTYITMIKNLKSLGGILHSYKQTKITTSEKQTETSKKGAEPYKTKIGDTLVKIQSDENINVKKLTSKDIRYRNSKMLSSYPKDTEVLPVGLSLVMENTFGQQMSTDRGNIRSGEDHASQAFSKLKRDIEILESSKDKGIGIDFNFINDITSNYNDSENKDVVKSLYNEINRYLVGDKKSNLQDRDALYKESIEIISDKNKRVIVAEKIARFSKRALQFDKEGLYGQLGDLGTNLKTFVDSIKILMSSSSEPKLENSLSDYKSFISLINESDEDSEVSDPVIMNTSQKIEDWWDKKIDIKEFVLTRSQVEKIRLNFEKISKKESIVIDGLDPIIEIVKVFNRAYKLHTTQTIPTGRSGGKVSNKTFQEYTSFGGGSPDSAGASGGPYRNNVIFDQWENAVQNIIKDTKYQKIFREETTLRTSENNIIKNAGKNLLKFMNDMLDGDTLYKTRDGKGRQAEFIEKYFSASDEDKKKLDKEGYLTIDGKNESNEISKNANSIKTINLEYTDSLILVNKYEDLIGSFFATMTNNNKQIYFYIQAVVDGYVYISYCRSMYFFKKYITESGNSIRLMKGKLPLVIKLEKLNKEKDFLISAFRMKPENLINKEGKFLLSGSYSIKKIINFDGDKNKSTNSRLGEDDEIDFKSIYTLQSKVVNEKVSKRFVLTKANNSIQKNGGFVTLEKSRDIEKTMITKNK